MLNCDKIKRQLPTMNISSIRNLIKAIYDERKHNRKMCNSDIKQLQELEKEADKILKQRRMINEQTEKEYNDWKKKMDKERRCY